jgi:hypothetical protein
VVPNTILSYELTGITVRTASRTAAPPFSRLHGGQAKRPRILSCGSTARSIRKPASDTVLIMSEKVLVLSDLRSIGVGAKLEGSAPQELRGVLVVLLGQRRVDEQVPTAGVLEYLDRRVHGADGLGQFFGPAWQLERVAVGVVELSWDAARPSLCANHRQRKRMRQRTSTVARGADHDKPTPVARGSEVARTRQSGLVPVRTTLV